jgi:prepilin-type N-terminal cleavage/methylation domain-containing protein
MKCHSDNNLFGRRSAFTLPEVMAAVVILGLICSSTFVVVTRAMASAADSAMRMNAFHVVRDNMEMLLSQDSVAEMTDSGYSERYPEIDWETTVESFTEPLNSRMWIQATCKAVYLDSEGEEQTIELTHWVTGLSDQQIDQMNREQEKLREYLSDKGYDPREIDKILKGEEPNPETGRQRKPLTGPFSF